MVRYSQVISRIETEASRPARLASRRVKFDLTVIIAENHSAETVQVRAPQVFWGAVSDLRSYSYNGRPRFFLRMLCEKTLQ
jgi:hypothetical protein